MLMVRTVSELVSLVDQMGPGERVVFDGATELPLPTEAYLASGRIGKAYGVAQLLKWPYTAKRGRFQVTPEHGSSMTVEDGFLNFRCRQNKLLFQVVPVDETTVFVNVCGDCRRRRHMRRVTRT